MPTPSGAAKICGICGTDCSTKERIKDAKGRYFCKSCYERAMKQKRSGASVTVKADRPALDAEPSNMLEKLLEAERAMPAAPPAQTFLCSKCGSPMLAGAVICTACGFNLQTQQAPVKTKVKVKRQTSGGVIWPPVIGIISMILGGGGVLIYGAQLLLTVFAAMQAGFGGAIVIIGIGTLLTSLSFWLLRDGYRILRRDSDGVKWIRFWAMTKVLIYGSCLAMFMSVPARQLDEGLVASEMGGLDVTGSDIKEWILLVMLWFLLWPVVILVFFFTPRIMRDVEEWD